jgi:hypothetical protein
MVSNNKTKLGGMNDREKGKLTDESQLLFPFALTHVKCNFKKFVAS